MNFQLLYRDITCSEERLVSWLAHKKLIPSKMVCKCGLDMALKRETQFCGYFICDRKDLHENGFYAIVPRLEKTLFENEYVPVDVVVVMMICKVNFLTFEQIIIECYHRIALNPTIIMAYFLLFDEAVSETMFHRGYLNRDPMGGGEAVVEIVQEEFEENRISALETSRTITDGTAFVAILDLKSSHYRIIRCDDLGDTKTLFAFIQVLLKPGTTILWERFRDFERLDTWKWFRYSDDFSNHPISYHRYQQTGSRYPEHGYLKGADKFFHFLHFQKCRVSIEYRFDAFVQILSEVYTRD